MKLHNPFADQIDPRCSQCGEPQATSVRYCSLSCKMAAADCVPPVLGSSKGPVPSLGPTTNSPIYDDMLDEWATPTFPHVIWLRNWELFSEWENYGLPGIKPIPFDLRHSVRIVDPEAPGIGDTIKYLTNEEWFDLQFNGNLPW